MSADTLALTTPLPHEEGLQNAETHRIFIADDHPVLRLGMRSLIEHQRDLKVCGEYDRAEGLPQAIENSKPDLVILDTSFRDGCGLEVLTQLRQMGNEIPVMVVSTQEESDRVSKAIRSGANGIVMKHEETKSILKGIRSVLDGEMFINKRLQRTVITEMCGADVSEAGGSCSSGPLDKLTAREREIYEYVGAGLVSKQIASKLKISASTVDVHKANIRAKLGLKTAPELLQNAIQHCSQ